MKKPVLLLLCAGWIVIAVNSQAVATNVQLSLITSDPTLASGTWTVSATLSDNQSLGIASFAFDVMATGGNVALKNSTVSATNQAPNPPYSLFRTTGTLSSPNLINVAAFRIRFRPSRTMILRSSALAMVSPGPCTVRSMETSPVAVQ
jgi:hypothetical protein